MAGGKELSGNTPVPETPHSVLQEQIHLQGERVDALLQIVEDQQRTIERLPSIFSFLLLLHNWQEFTKNASLPNKETPGKLRSWPENEV